MSENYQPPFTMNEEITNLIVEIGEYVGAISMILCAQIQFCVGKIELGQYIHL